MKAKITNQVVSVPHAWIVNSTDQGRKSIKKGNLVYLQDNTEFKIELFNPLKENVLADIKINSQSISKTGLVIRPGQRCYLDCYLDDRKKFVFKTYTVENTEESKEAIQNNGIVEVFFYKEDVLQFNNWNNNWYTNLSQPFNPYNPYNIYNSGTAGGYFCDTLTNNIDLGGIFSGSTNFDNTITNCSNTFAASNSSNGKLYNNPLRSKVKFSKSINTLDNIETGRIEKGEVSSQKFTEVDMKFKTWTISVIKYQLLPESQKPIETETLKSKPNDFYDVLKKLADLHECGVLTDEEFNTKKKEILSKI